MGNSVRGRRRLVLLAAVIALDIVLVSVALRSQPGASVAVAESVPATAEPGSPTTAPTELSVPASPALLVDLSGTTAFRVSGPGTCAAGGAAVQVSTDGGDTWTDAEVPVRTVLRVLVTGTGAATMIGAGTDCRPASYQTTDAGRSWVRSGDTAGTWHRYGSAVARLHVPSRDAALPCPAGVALTDLAPGSVTRATVLCSDGSLHQTTDGGTRWTRRGELGGAVAINQSSVDRLVAAVTGVPGCSGVQVQTSDDGGTTWVAAGCAAGARSEAAVGVTFSDAERGLLVTRDATYRTSDGGASWSAL
ncbi:MAG: hypothetical protein JWN54_2840 [Mycobacterium sp.]|nr:hypothetical protein [Mycobacterium sp.]